MKKTVFLIVVLLFSLILAACGSSGQSDAAQAAGEVGASDTITQAVVGAVAPDDENRPETPLAMKLALGTFRLEETDYPIDAKQAAELLPLWKAARSLSESETTAAQEIDALVNQIQGAMTPEQVEAIDAMELSFQDMRSVAEELGLDFGAGGAFSGDMDPEMQATMQSARESGQAPPGGFGPGEIPGMGAGPGGGGSLSPEARQTDMAERGVSRGATIGLNPVLLDAIIEFLEAKVL